MILRGTDSASSSAYYDFAFRMAGDLYRICQLILPAFRLIEKLYMGLKYRVLGRKLERKKIVTYVIARGNFFSEMISYQREFLV